MKNPMEILRKDKREYERIYPPRFLLQNRVTTLFIILYTYSVI